MFGIGYQEMIIIAIIGVLMFGGELPEIARSLGKTINQFKRAMSGLEDEVERVTNINPMAASNSNSYTSNSASSTAAAYQESSPRPPQRIAASVPKFEDPPFDETVVENTNKPGEIGNSSSPLPAFSPTSNFGNPI